MSNDQAIPSQAITNAPDKSHSIQGSSSNSDISQTTIIDRIAEFIRRFVKLPDDSIYQLVAAWIVGTYMVADFYYYGYLFIGSKVKHTGKTTLLKMLDLLVWNSSGIQVSITEAVLFRTAAGYTQLLDEVDTLANHYYLRGVLNVGFERGMMVTRLQCIDGRWEPVKMPVYCARAMAGIGEPFTDTTRDRTFVIHMVPRTADERGQRLRADRLSSEIDELKRQIDRWVEKHRNEVAQRYNKDQAVPYLTAFRDRTIDIAEPLAAIVETVYATDPRLQDATRELVIAIGKTRRENEYRAADRQLVCQLLDLTEGADPLIGTATELAKCCNLNDEDSTGRMSATLRRYGFETKSIRLGNMSKYRYSLDRASLISILNRYFGEGREEEPGSVVDVVAQ